MFAAGSGEVGVDSIKYRYALDEDSMVVDIITGRAVKTKAYTCLSCSKILLPIQGGERQHHFRHKVQADCSAETYLHNLAKRIFAQTYQDCLDGGRSYTVSYHVPVRCIDCNDLGPCEVGHQLQSVDLTKHFKSIDIESRVDGFVPDILLSSQANRLFIEIAVTHFVEEKKNSSGNRIVEIHINDESDIDLITSCLLTDEDPRIKIANFRKTPVDLSLADQCTKTIGCFIVYPSGKCILDSVPVPKYEAVSSKAVHIEKIGNFTRASLQEEFTIRLGKAFQRGIPVKNCWLCSFHCLRFQTLQSFCRLNKTVVENSNQAVGCENYRQIKKLPECGLITDAQNKLIEAQAKRTKERQQSKESAKRMQDDEQDLGHDFFVRMEKVSAKSTNETHTYQHQQAPQVPTSEIAKATQERPKSGKKASCVFCGAVFEEESIDWWWFNAEKGECKCKPCLQKGLS